MEVLLQVFVKLLRGRVWVGVFLNFYVGILGQAFFRLLRGRFGTISFSAFTLACWERYF